MSVLSISLSLTTVSDGYYLILNVPGLAHALCLQQVQVLFAANFKSCQTWKAKSPVFLFFNSSLFMILNH